MVSPLPTASGAVLRRVVLVRGGMMGRRRVGSPPANPAEPARGSMTMMVGTATVRSMIPRNYRVRRARFGSAPWVTRALPCSPSPSPPLRACDRPAAKRKPKAWLAAHPGVELLSRDRGSGVARPLKGSQTSGNAPIAGYRGSPCTRLLTSDGLLREAGFSSRGPRAPLFVDPWRTIFPDQEVIPKACRPIQGRRAG